MKQLGHEVRLCAFGVMLAAAHPALAQTSPAVLADAAGVRSDDIVVTAQRREQEAIDVPLAMTAVRGETIRELGVTSPSELFTQIPNVRYQTSTGTSGFPIFNIRGVTLLDFSDTNESPIATYVDDVYLGSSSVQNQQLFDMERVEVLRGPQGTLYGRNAEGGLINFITRKPTDTFEAYASLTYGSFNQVAAEGAISGPLAENLRARVAARFARADGWQTNLFNGAKFGGVNHRIAIRSTVEFDASDTLSLSGNFHYSDYKGQSDGRAMFGAKVPGSVPPVRCSTEQIFAAVCTNAGGFRDPHPDPQHVYSEETSQPANSNNYGGWLRAEWDLGFAKLTSITAYENAEKLETNDTDGSPIPSLSTVFTSDFKQFSQELRLSGETGRFNWVFGGFYYTDKRFYTVILTKLGGFGSWADQDVKSGAGFFQTTWAVTDTANLTGGIRYTKDDRELKRLGRVPPGGGGVPGTRLGNANYIISRDRPTSKVNWRLAADWHFHPDHMIYASVSTGYKGTAYNALLPSADPATVFGTDPENLTAYEIGLKGELADRRITYDIALFESKYNHVQAQGNLVIGGVTISTLDNIGDATIRGMEAQFSARPTDNLSMSLGVAILDTKIKSPPGFLFNGNPVDGNRLVLAPDFSASGAIRYEYPLSNGHKIYVAADANWQEKVFFGPDNLPTEKQKAYGLVNAHVGWKNADADLQLDLFVKNLTNEEYFLHSTDSGGAQHALLPWGRSRTWGVTLRKSFQ